MKALKMIFWFRFFSVIDVLFSKHFELKTFDKNGNKTSETKFSSKEIKEKIK